MFKWKKQVNKNIDDYGKSGANARFVYDNQAKDLFIYRVEGIYEDKTQKEIKSYY